MSECSGNISTDRPNYRFVLNKNSINSYNVLYWLTKESEYPMPLYWQFHLFFKKCIQWLKIFAISKQLSLRRTLSQLKTLKHGADRQYWWVCFTLLLGGESLCGQSNICLLPESAFLKVQWNPGCNDTATWKYYTIYLGISSWNSLPKQY